MTTSVTRKLVAAAGAGVLAFAVASCGSAGTGGEDGIANGPARQRGGPQAQQDSLGQGPGGAFPGAMGKVAAVTGSTAQVQGVEGQVAVTWTTTTAFTQEVEGALSAVKVGSCVFVTSKDAGRPDAAPTTVTAATVRITSRTDGSCVPKAAPPGAGGGSQPGGPQFEGLPPSGAPTGRPQVHGMGAAVGEVSAVTASGFTVAATVPGSDDTTTVTVTVDGDTAYTTTARASAADMKVGTCVHATGQADETGAVTATRIAISRPHDGECGGPMRLRAPGGSNAQES